MKCPTDVRKAHFWCFGEDAIFHYPCGPTRQYYGHKPTCWREWPSSGSDWRDVYCSSLIQESEVYPGAAIPFDETLPGAEAINPFSESLPQPPMFEQGHDSLPTSEAVDRGPLETVPAEPGLADPGLVEPPTEPTPIPESTESQGWDQPPTQQYQQTSYSLRVQPQSEPQDFPADQSQESLEQQTAAALQRLITSDAEPPSGD